VSDLRIVRVVRRDGSKYLARVLPNPIPREVVQTLAKGRADRKKVDRHTYLVGNEDGSISLVLHATNVVTYYPNKLVLKTGGWHTMTTRDRIQAGLTMAGVGGGISTTGRGIGGPWLYLQFPGGGIRPEVSYPFEEGMEIDYSGRVLNVKPGGETPRDTAVALAIERYLKAVKKALHDPSWNGHAEDSRWAGTISEAVNRRIVSRRLILAAMQETGYRTDVYDVILDDPGARTGHASTFIRALRRYLRKRALSHAA